MPPRSPKRSCGSSIIPTSARDLPPRRGSADSGTTSASSFVRWNGSTRSSTKSRGHHGARAFSGRTCRFSPPGSPGDRRHTHRRAGGRHATPRRGRLGRAHPAAPGVRHHDRFSEDRAGLQGRRSDLLQPGPQPGPRFRFRVRAQGSDPRLGRVSGAGRDLSEAREARRDSAVADVPVRAARQGGGSGPHPPLLLESVHLSAGGRAVCLRRRHQRFPDPARAAASASICIFVYLFIAARGSPPLSAAVLRGRVPVRVGRAGVFRLAHS